jgi:hypothetical protein
MFENSGLRKILGWKMEDVTGGWRKCVMRSFIRYALYCVVVA